MTDLVACLSSGKGTWGHVAKLIEDAAFENVYIVTDSFGKENFKPAKNNTHLIVIDPNKTISEMAEDVTNNLKGKLKGLDVAINIVSGSGKEHMAVISAVLKLGFGIRFIAFTPEGIKEI